VVPFKITLPRTRDFTGLARGKTDTPSWRALSAMDRRIGQGKPGNLSFRARRSANRNPEQAKPLDSRFARQGARAPRNDGGLAAARRCRLLSVQTG